MGDYSRIEAKVLRDRARSVAYVVGGVAALVVLALVSAWYFDRPPLREGAVLIGRVVGMHGHQTYGPPQTYLIVELDHGRRVSVIHPRGAAVAKGSEVSIQELLNADGEVLTHRYVTIVAEHLQRPMDRAE